jgi:hypothetical protein
MVRTRFGVQHFTLVTKDLDRAKTIKQYSANQINKFVSNKSLPLLQTRSFFECY